MHIWVQLKSKPLRTLRCIYKLQAHSARWRLAIRRIPDGAHECDASQQSKTQPSGHAAMGRPWEVPFKFPNGHPRRSVHCMRTILASGDSGMDVMHTLYKAYWVDEQDVAQPEVVAQVLQAANLNLMESPSDGANNKRMSQSPNR